MSPAVSSPASPLVYACAAVNTCRRAAAVCAVSGLLVYGADTRLMCYCPTLGGVVGVSDTPSNGTVTCVRCVRGAASYIVLATYSSGDAALWTMTGPRGHPGAVTDMLTRRVYLKAHHKQSVSCGDLILLEAQDALVATAGLDGHMKLVTVTMDTGAVLSSRTIVLRNRALALDLRLLLPPSTSLPPLHLPAPSVPLLLYGGDDSKVHVLALNGDDGCADPYGSDARAGGGGITYAHEYEVATLSGHRDWVTTLDYVPLCDGNVMLASGSKDGTVRVWRLTLCSEAGADNSPSSSADANNHNSNADVENEADHDSDEDGESADERRDVPSGELSVRPMLLRGGRGSVALETVLCGHDGWLAHVCWYRLNDGPVPERLLRLLSCAQTEDRSIVLWQPRLAGLATDSDCDVDAINNCREYVDSGGGGGGAAAGTDDGEVWVEAARLGEVGGNREGFFSALFSLDGRAVYGHAYQGGLHAWKRCGDRWEPQPAPTGHFQPVADLAWERDEGRYLLTAGTDQTTRLHAPVSTAGEVSWREVCRPQVHGHDLTCVASTGFCGFVSGAEEKTLRAFEAPTALMEGLNALCGWRAGEELGSREFVEAAAVPALGLSNKSVAQPQPDRGPRGSEAAPPTESSLMSASLWPECRKLYGHGHALLCVAASRCHLATACRAAAQQDAAIIIWGSVESYSSSKGALQSPGSPAGLPWCARTHCLLQTLLHHRLSVTQLRFSPDGKMLLSVSRDRGWALHGREEEDSAPYALLYHSSLCGPSQQHSRIVWAGAWLHQQGFVTVSRDKTMVVWGLMERQQQEVPPPADEAPPSGVNTLAQPQQQVWTRHTTVTLEDEVTAVAATNLTADTWLIATGLGSGTIFLHQYNEIQRAVTAHRNLTPSHHGSVRCLSFRPRQKIYEEPKKTNPSQIKSLFLASCGTDHLTCVYDCTYLINRM